MSGAIVGRGVQSVEVGARLLSAMVEIGEPAMLRDLAAKAKITSAQAHAYLVSFRKSGLVEQDAATGRYLLGPFALQLGLSRMRQVDPLRVASEAAAQLAAEMHLMVTVAVWGTHGPTIVLVHESNSPIHVNLRAGTVYTVTGTATGRLFAAYLPDSTVRPLVQAELRAGREKRAVGVPTALSALSRSSLEIRRQGFATTEGVPVPGINAVAAPVFDHTGELQCVITIIGSEALLEVGPESPAALRLKAFCQSLSERLGHADEPGRDMRPEPAIVTDIASAQPRSSRRRG